MGALVGGCYAMGITPGEMRSLVRDVNWNDALLGAPDYEALSFRRKEDLRDIPTRLSVGLRDGITLPEGLSPANSVGLLLSRICLPYSQIKSFEDLGLPKVVAELCRRPRGLILVTGPTGSGKSTTLATMIDRINASRHQHILTIEDPIEFLHTHKRCVVNQRELGADAPSFALGLKAALRQDPDVILVGEMRDLETIHTALTAAETGHLVFATLHTQDTPQTIDRIIDVFPPEQQQQVRVQLSVALQGIVTQQLLPTLDGSGRVAACEVLVPTPAIRNLIREGKTHQIYSALQTGSSHGMQTMDTALAQLVRSGQISAKLAESRSTTPEELRRLLGMALHAA